MLNTMLDLKDWYPARVIEDGGDYRIRWQYLGQQKFDQAFYSDSLGLALTRYQRAAIETPIGILDSMDDDYSAVPLSGLIFHVSRCGSTLLSRMLSVLPGLAVLSEPPPIDDLLRSKLDDDTRRHYLKKLFQVLRRKRRSENLQGIYFKLDAWHTPAIGELRALLPDACFLFLYRNPLEVLVSHRRQAGMLAVPGLIDPRWYGDHARNSLELHPYEYAAWALGRIMRHVAKQINWRVELLNYGELGENGWSRVPRLLNLEADWESTRSARRRHAKSDADFTDDIADKLALADDGTQQYCRCHTVKPYERLEAIRLTSIQP